MGYSSPSSSAPAPPAPVQQDISSQDLCGQCQEVIAEFACQECRERFCRKCCDQVHQRGRLKEHTRVPILRDGMMQSGSLLDNSLSEIANPAARQRDLSPFLGGRVVYCKEHPEDPLQFFCLQCEREKNYSECICAECALHGAHKGHDVVSVRKAYQDPELRRRMQEALQRAQGIMEERERANEIANSERAEVEAVISQGKREIQDAFEKMRQSLSKKEAQLLLAADQTERRANSKLRAKTKAAEEHVRTLQEAQAALRKLDARGEEVKVLNAYAIIRAKVLSVLRPMEGLDVGVEQDLEELKAEVQADLDQQVRAVAALSSRVADIRSADASLK